METPVLSETSDGILTLTLDRPEKKNALTDAMYGALADGFAAAAVDDAVRAVLITSNGDSFTAGNDLGDFMSVAAGTADVRQAQVWRLLDWLARFEKPLVAAVPGVAVGVGTTMLLHCDLVYLAEDAVLATPFVDLALVPEAASSLLLPARIGHVRAFAMFALGERMTAQEALAAGIANRVVPRDALQQTARAAAVALAGRPPAALRITKALMRDTAALTQRTAEEGALFSAQLKSPEAMQAFAAFAARAPSRP